MGDDAPVTTDGGIRLRLVGFLPWDDVVAPVIGPTGPAEGAGAIEIPGRQTLPGRTRLEPAAGGGGLIGRVVDPGGEPRPLAVRFVDGAAALIDIDPPLALAPADNGFWSMDRDGLSAVSAQGVVRVRLAVSGIRILPGPNGGVWVLGADRCWFVNAVGGVSEFSSPWREPFDSCVDGDALTGWDPDRSGGLVSLSSTGHLQRRSLDVHRGLFERPLAFGPGESLSAALRTLVHRESARERAVAMTGAGLTSDGVPYFAGRVGDRMWLWRGNSPAQELVPADTEQIVAVQGNRVLTWSGQRAAWWELRASDQGPAETAGSGVVVASGWRVFDPYPFFSAPGGEAVFASSGPTGVAVLRLCWPPAG